MAEDFDTYTRKTITRNFFRSMVGRAMFCPKCGAVLDYRRAVLFGNIILCGKCYDAARVHAVEKRGAEAVEKLEQELSKKLDFIDGRKLGGR